MTVCAVGLGTFQKVFDGIGTIELIRHLGSLDDAPYAHAPLPHLRRLHPMWFFGPPDIKGSFINCLLLPFVFLRPVVRARSAQHSLPYSIR